MKYRHVKNVPIIIILTISFGLLSACNSEQNNNYSQANLEFIDTNHNSKMILSADSSEIFNPITSIRYIITNLETNESEVIYHGTDHLEPRSYFTNSGSYSVALEIDTISTDNDITSTTTTIDTGTIVIESDYISLELGDGNECRYIASSYSSSDDVVFIQSDFDDSECNDSIFYILNLSDLEKLITSYITDNNLSSIYEYSGDNSICISAYGSKGKNSKGGAGGIAQTVATINDLKNSNNDNDFLRIFLGKDGGSTVVTTQDISDSSTSIYDSSKSDVGTLYLVGGGGGEGKNDDGGNGGSVYSDTEKCNMKSGDSGKDTDHGKGGGKDATHWVCSDIFSNIKNDSPGGEGYPNGKSGIGGKGSSSWYNATLPNIGTDGDGGKNTTGGTGKCNYCGDGGGGFGGGGGSDSNAGAGGAGSFSYGITTTADDKKCYTLDEYTTNPSSSGKVSFIVYLDDITSN